MCDCEQALELLSLKLDGQLNETEALELADHLASCGACKSLARDLEALHKRMPLLEENLPEDFHQSLMDRIGAEPASLPSSKGHKKTFPIKWFSMVAVLALVLIGAGTLPRFLSLGSSSSASMAGSTPSSSLSESQFGTNAALGKTPEFDTPADKEDSSMEVAPQENGQPSPAPRMALYQADAGGDALSEDVRTQLISACTEWLQNSSLSQKDQVDTALVQISSPSEEDLTAVIGSAEALSQLDTSDWKVILGDSSGQNFVTLFCDSDTLTVLGYLPVT